MTIKVEKTKMRLLQVNLLLWFVIILTIAIHLNFGDNIKPITSKQIQGLEMIQEIIVPANIITLIFAVIIATPIVILTTKLYDRTLRNRVVME